MSISTIVEMELAPGKVESLRDAIDEFVRLTSEEGGNLRFEVYADESNPNRVLVFEEWADEEAHDAHTKLAHTLSFRQKTLEAIAKPPTVRHLRAIARGTADV